MSKAWLFIVSIPFIIAALVVNFVLTTEDLSKAELARNASLLDWPLSMALKMRI
jgi:hypothetical protein